MQIHLDVSGLDGDPREVAAGETIFREYDMGAEMYVVLEGEVELTLGGTVVEMLGRGDPFGEMALIDQAPRAATATAKTACKLAVLPEKRFLFLVQTRPHFALDIMKVMAERLRAMNAKA